MNKLPKRLAILNENELEELKSACQICLILGGLKTCSCHSLEGFATLTGLSKKTLLKWYQNNNKKFLKKLKKGIDK